MQKPPARRLFCVRPGRWAAFRDGLDGPSVTQRIPSLAPLRRRGHPSAYSTFPGRPFLPGRRIGVHPLPIRTSVLSARGHCTPAVTRPYVARPRRKQSRSGLRRENRLRKSVHATARANEKQPPAAGKLLRNSMLGRTPGRPAPRYFNASITRAMRANTSSIDPMPSTAAYLPCAA